ncbi:protein kinase [Acidobacteriota bacterium]
MANVCPSCSTKNTSDSTYCKGCATRLTPSDEAQIIQTATLEIPKEELSAGLIFAGRYKIIEDLGQGGMGRVYKAFDNEVKEEIAIKLLKTEIASNIKTIERFRNELKLSRKIGHKNVCRMYDFNKEGSTYYITMEYVSGENLKIFIQKSKRLTPDAIISIGQQVSEGLSEAHRMGVIHRDLKPQNIMIDKAGHARIMDFGIAYVPKGKGITEEGTIIGTPEYMSPEQAEAKKVDERSDIYSLGVVLFEMATGQVPFTGKSALSVALKHKTEFPENPKLLNPQIPKYLCSIILRCLEKDWDNRYQNAEELLSALKGHPDQIKAAQLPKWKTSIAVLPFKNLSPDPEQEYFCDGLAEELINVFTQIRELRVVARTSAFSFKGQDIDIRDIGQKLNVETVLEGSVRKAGNRVRVTSQLINVADGYHLWSERYDGELEHIFTLQDNIAESIVNALRIEILGEKVEPIIKTEAVNAEAYESYLRGRFHMYKFLPEHYEISLKHFHLALKKYPDYALAYSGIGFNWLSKANLGFAPLRESFLKSKKAAQKAIELDGTLSEAHEVLGTVRFYFEWDWIRAQESMARAIELNPNNVNARIIYAEFLSSMGRSEEAATEIEKAIELDPLNHYPQQIHGGYLLQSHRYDEAVAHFKKILKIEPNFFVSHEGLWISYHQMGKDKEAVLEARKYFAAQEFDDVAKALVRGYKKADYAEAMRQGALVLEERSKKNLVLSTRIALMYAHAGEKDRAIDWLEKAFKEGETFMVYLKADLQWDLLHDNSRFQNLLSQMNYPKKK